MTASELERIEINLAQARADGMQASLANAEQEIEKLREQSRKYDDLTDEHKADRRVASLLAQLHGSAFRNEQLWSELDSTKEALAKARASCKRKSKLIGKLEAKIKALTTCDCGASRSIGRCNGYCENDE